jgi:hypothetical protein
VSVGSNGPETPSNSQTDHANDAGRLQSELVDAGVLYPPANVCFFRDWPRFLEGLRDAGLKAYKAAQSKNQENVADAADTLTRAYANCHRKWREKEACGPMQVTSSHGSALLAAGVRTAIGAELRHW